MSILTQPLVSRWLNILALISLVGQLFVPLAHASRLNRPLQPTSLVDQNTFWPEVAMTKTGSGGVSTINPHPELGLSNLLALTGSLNLPPTSTLEATPIPPAPPEPPSSESLADVQTGLVAYWSLDEARGLRYDSVSRNHLKALNPWLGNTPGQTGLALNLVEGEALVLEEQFQQGLALRDSLTLAGWVKLDGVTEESSLLSRYDQSSKGYRLDVASDQTVVLRLSGDGQTDSVLTSTVPLVSGQWSHLAAVFSGAEQRMSLYINGQLQATQPVSFSQIYPASSHFALGGRTQGDDVSHTFKGALDGWRVYGRALSQADIGALLTGPQAGLSITSSDSLTVQFDNLSTLAQSYIWDYGDGTTSTTTDLSHSHTYTQAGLYTLTLQAQGNDQRDKIAYPVQVMVGNQRVANEQNHHIYLPLIWRNGNTSDPNDGETTTQLGLGLVSHWRLDETGGLRYDDGSNLNHLQEQNSVGSQVGMIGLGAEFELGQQEVLTLSHSQQVGLAITDSLTLVGWVKLHSIDDFRIMASKYEMGVINRAYRLGLAGNKKLQFILSPDGNYSIDHNLLGQTELMTDTWYHVAGVFDAQKKMMKIYLDGNLEGQQVVDFNTLYSATAPFMLGANMSQSVVSQYLDGLLDDWRVYNRALNKQEIEGLMAIPKTELALDFTATPLTGMAPLTVTFTNLSTGADSYLWHFGDGITSTLSSLSHTYTEAGVYTLSLQANNAQGTKTITKSNYVIVTDTPVSTYTLSLKAVGNGSISVTPNQSSYVAGDVVTLTASAGIGTIFTGWSGDIIASDPQLRVIMAEDKRLTATFSTLPLNVYQTDFEGYTEGDDPLNWYDSGPDYALVEDNSLFKVYEFGDNKVFGTVSTANHIHSHYVGPMVLGQGYEYTGRLLMSDSDSGVGLTFYSHYPNSNTYYRLGRNKDNPSFELYPNLSGHNLQGQVDSGLTPAPNTWYNFKIHLLDTSTETELKAKIWPTTQTEPHPWQIEASDDSAVRLTQGQMGLWATGAGRKYWDNLRWQAIADAYHLDIQVQGAGQVQISPAQTSYSPGQTVILTPTAESGWVFSGWYGDVQNEDIPLRLSMDGHKNLVAVFNPDPNLTFGLITPAGGTIVNQRGDLSLVFPPRAVTENLIIIIDDIPPDITTDTPDNKAEIVQPIPGGPFTFFRFKAKRSDGTLLEGLQFAKPVTLRYRYEPVLLDDSDILAESLHLLYYNQDAQDFDLIPSTVNTHSQQLVAELAHFSDYAVAGENAGWTSPGINAFDVSLSRGSTTYSYDLPLPVGAGGMAPKLTLQYNSGIPNGMGGDKNTDTGWVGTGWSLDVGRMTKDSITLNGLSEEIIQDNQDSNQYHTRHQNYLDIKQIDRGLTSTCLQDIQRAYRWEVRDTAGTLYHFGGLDSTGTDSTLSFMKHVGGNSRSSDDDGWAWRHRVYKLNQVEDVHGNRMEITYNRHGGRLQCGVHAVAESYPRSIRYTLNNHVGDAHAEYEVLFDVVHKGYTPGNNEYTRYGDRSYKLEGLEVKYHHPDGQSQTIRYIDFVYDTDQDDKTNILQQIIIKDHKDGQALPALEFGYQNKEISVFFREPDDDGSGTDFSSKTYQRPFLNKVINHYGGEIDYSYQTVSERGKPLFQVVDKRSLSEKLTNQTHTYHYDYGQMNLARKYKKGKIHAIHYGHFRGFAQVTVTDPAGNVRQNFFHNGGDSEDPDHLNSRLLETRLYGPDPDGPIGPYPVPTHL